jgi:lipopolysaccharide transport system permease protein
MPFLLQVLLFASPIAYPLNSTWAYVNPLTGILESFRWAVIGAPVPPVGAIASSVSGAFVLLIVALVYFARAERTFADLA